MRPNVFQVRWLFLIAAAGLPMSQGQENGDAGMAEEASAEVETAVFVGTRVPDRSVAESPVPVDVITQDNLSARGFTDMDALLSQTVPSYNVGTEPISDAATLVRPATLRGLPPDSTLVLINGKRRHRGSVITFLGGGISDGAQGPDLAAIPYIALRQVEVLRDGASAQYGSDAVAGIINFVLKDDAQGGRVETRWGQYYEGDGASYTVAANAGMPIRIGGEPSGFANFSVEYTETQDTVRSAQRADAQALIDANEDHISPYIRQPYAQVWGQPDVEYDYKFFGNTGLDLGDSSQLYLMPSFARRKVEGGFFFRNPTNRSGVNRGEVVEMDGVEYQTVKVADLRHDPDPATVPVVRLLPDPDNGALIPDPDALAAVAASPDFFAFNEKFPGGFTPKFGGTITDMSLVGGIRGEFESGWIYDASASIGRHKSEFYMRNTINPQLIAHPDFRDDPARIPLNYRPGNYIETDHAFNLDFSKAVDLEMFSSPLNVAAGLEYRIEEFEIEAGEEYAWWVDRRPGGVAEQGFGVGSNGFPAFPPSISGVTDRGSASAYLDLEANVTRRLLVGAAVRYENFDGDVGDTTNGKISARYQLSEQFALRGSVSTGFRAPTLGQASVRNVTTAFAALPGGGIGLADVATLPFSELPPGEFEGSRPLEPETSLSVSVGSAFSVGSLDVTLDYYRVSVDDRIALTSFSPWPADAPNPNNYSQVRWFANDFDTVTQGVDLVASYPFDTEMGTTTVSLAVNYNRTEVERAGRYVNAQRVEQLEDSLPDYRFTLSADHEFGAWRLVLPRLRYYGDFVGYAADSWRGEYGAKVLVDLEASYAFGSGITLAAGAQNVLDEYTDLNPLEAIEGVGILYAENSPYGFGGGFYYIKAAYSF